MNYPKGIKIENKNKEINYSNRGMNLENDLNTTNEYYRSINKAYIYKKPTPIKITKVDYKKNKIIEAYFETPSTTDYNGLYNCKYVDYEAKETTSTTSFPLNNIHAHQIKHLENIYLNGGISFLIIRFTKLNKTYLLFTKDLLNYLSTYDKKSIPLSYFEEKAHQIMDSYIPRIDYLKVLDKYERYIYEK